MNRAIRLLIICAMAAALLAAWAVCAAAEEEPAALPETEVQAPDDMDVSMDPVDAPAAMPSGTVYTVGKAGVDAVTVVDYTGEGAESGVYLSGGSGFYYGAQISGADCGAVIDGAYSLYFGSSNGSLPLYDGRGAVSGIVWGSCRPTAVECGDGIVLNGDVISGVLVEDGASFSCSGAVVRCAAGSGSFRFCNARLSSDIGVLADLGADAGDVDVCFENGSYSGSLANGSQSTLSVTVGRGALLCGDTVQTSGPVQVTVAAGGIWVVKESAGVDRLTVEEGATVYGTLTENEDGSLTIAPSDEMLQPGTYDAQPVAETLPMGHGPAQPAEGDAPAPEAQQPKEEKLFPLPIADDDAQEPESPVAEEEAPVAEEEAAPAEEETEEEPAYDERLFPLAPDGGEQTEPDADDEEQEPLPAAEETPEEEDGQLAARRSLLMGVALGCPYPTSAQSGPLGLAAQLTLRPGDQPPAASVLKAGVKTNSFLLEALDNRAIILYNPYCCSAA